MRDEYLPFNRPSIGEDAVKEVADSLRSGWITTGPKAKQLEEEFADFVDAGRAVAVNSCTAGLHLALAALDIGEGDEVIVPTMTFCATANEVVHRGARPVLVDVGPDGNVRAEAVEEAVTDRTKAVMPVHYAGRACDLEGIYQVAGEHGLAVVEDAAHAVGARLGGEAIGGGRLAAELEVPRVSAFSFYATKNMTTGEGGMVTTEDDGLADRMETLRLHGMSRDAWKRYSEKGSWYYEVVEAGYKYNLSDLQAAVGLHQLRRLPAFNRRRRELAAIYDEAFAPLEGVTPLPAGEPEEHARHLYVVRIAEAAGGRDAFVEALEERNIGTSVHFIPIHRHPFYRDELEADLGDFPVAEKLYREIVSLPLYPAMDDTDAWDVVVAVRKVVA